MDLLLDWSDEKAEQNVANHGLDFEDAVAVWDDILRDEWFDERKEYVWLISASSSTRSECERYFERLGR